jgi:hypothetical protein
MAWGILESNRLEHVPGTSLLDDDAVGASAVSSTLKRGTGKQQHIVLVPQPSNDLNDPLRWPLWQRDLMLLMYLYVTLLSVGG